MSNIYMYKCQVIENKITIQKGHWEFSVGFVLKHFGIIGT